MNKTRKLKKTLTKIYVLYIIIHRYLSMGGESMELDTKETATIFKALGDENRIKILQLLSTGEKCACHLLEEIDITQPTMSHHMKILCDAGIVNGRKEGKWMHYSISEKGTAFAKQCFDFLLNANKTHETKDKSCCEK